MKRIRRHTYAGLTLLGNSTAAVPSAPQSAQLEIFPNPAPKRNYLICLQSPQFTSLCPVTGQPDFAEMKIEYVADRHCVETKSLKLYLAAYRNVPSFNEEVVNRILDDLVAACRPRWMRVEGHFAPRGGLALSVMAEQGTYPAKAHRAGSP